MRLQIPNKEKEKDSISAPVDRLYFFSLLATFIHKSSSNDSRDLYLQPWQKNWPRQWRRWILQKQWTNSSKPHCRFSSIEDLHSLQEQMAWKYTQYIFKKYQPIFATSQKFLSKLKKISCSQSWKNISRALSTE